jgi:type VI secretion system FHA domain protein
MSSTPSLTLNITGPSGQQSVTVHTQGATLGSGSNCTVVLANGRRAISRVQARIEWRGDHYVLIDTGGNATLVNGNALDASREAVLRDGDTLSIGAYMIGLAQARPSTIPPVADEPFFAQLPAALPEARDRAEHGDALRSSAATRVTPIAASTQAATDATPAAAFRRRTMPDSLAPIDSVSASSDAVIAALLEGLGVQRERVDDRSPVELARLIGVLLRDALQGTMEALRARSIAKQQTRVAMTMIDAHGNNPLKFFPDADGALTQMLRGGGGAWLGPRDALRQAFNDLRDHERALVAGLRATLADTLTGLAPERIEAQLRPLGRIEAALSNRHARLWDLYIDTWQQTKQRAGGNFQHVFREPFALAYDAQVAASAAAGPPASQV